MLSQHRPELIAIASGVLTGRGFCKADDGPHAFGVACSRGRQTKLFDFELPATRCCREVDKFVWGVRTGAHKQLSPQHHEEGNGGRQRQLGSPRSCMGLGGRWEWMEMLSGGVQAMAATYTDSTRLQMARDATGMRDRRLRGNGRWIFEVQPCCRDAEAGRMELLLMLRAVSVARNPRRGCGVCGHCGAWCVVPSTEGISSQISGSGSGELRHVPLDNLTTTAPLRFRPRSLHA